MVLEQKNVYMIIKTNHDTNIINSISKLKKKKTGLDIHIIKKKKKDEKEILWYADGS